MEQKERQHLGGSVEGALNGEHRISAEMIIKTAWTLSKDVRFVFVKAMLVVLGGALILTSIMITLGQSLDYNFEDEGQMLALQFAVSVLLSPLLVGIEMMGLSRAIGGHIRISNVFRFLSRSAFLIVAMLLTSSLVQIANGLFIPLGLFLSFTTMFVSMLIVEKDMNVFEAIKVSVIAVTRVFFPITLTMLPVAGVAIAVFASGVALQALLPVALLIAIVAFVFVVPWVYCVKGIIYCELFGVNVVKRANNIDDDSTGDSGSNGQFSA